MVKVSLLRSAALAALAVAGVLAAPVQAQTQDLDRANPRSEARAARQEARAARVEARAARQAERAAAPAAPEARVEARADRRAARVEARQPAGTVSTSAGSDWRSQRSGDGQRMGRRWDRNGSAVTPTAPTRGGDVNRTWSRDDSASDWRRNRTYTDPTRNRTYRDGRRADTSRDRDSYRSGSRTDSWRDRSSGYYAGSRDHRRWDRNDWRRDRRYDWYGYRNQHRSLFSIGRYYSPYRNYSYRRLGIGLFLDNGFYGNRYWISDPWQYRLPAVYGPYRWVRYYDDVLLVDIYTGEVVDVIHDFFW